MSVLTKLEDTVQGAWSGEAPKWLTASLGAGEASFRALVAAREAAYDEGWFLAHRAEVPVLSVGGLTVGGAGKTPVAIWFTAALRDAGARPALLTRGYRRDAESPADEVEMARGRLPDVPIVVDGDRSRGSAVAVLRHGATALVLDDGFQHRRLARDIDVVVLDAAAPFGNGRLLPRGPLREPPAALARATQVWLVDRGSGRAAEPNVPCEVVRASYRLDAAVAERLRGQSVSLVTGIAGPEAVRTLLARAGIAVDAHRAFPDHHPFRDAELAGLTGTLVVTEKDWPRLPAAWREPGRVVVARVELAFDTPADAARAQALVARMAGEARLPTP